MPSWITYINYIPDLLTVQTAGMFCSWQNKAGLNFVSLPSRCR